ncbi:DUF2158 domain-containing protein [Spirosoma sp. HMF3257]|uniref:DUF2158 domain-containing protein n=1 Tax=Spirosoma telluris TaxID=2183553 RepID=A0A327NFX4_9BACT|nr:DUF2158 domain-containing protein [Spirosoma telluris]RAI73735.1 DUF2158 domain-containing protein [Spirosoma telluris]
MNSEIKVGDTVKLKSGSPIMTVTLYREMFEQFSCSWFDGKKLMSADFSPEALVKVSLDSDQGYIQGSYV